MAERSRPDVLAAIAAGGIGGALARYGVARLVPVGTHAFPWATFWTNVSGSFLLGFGLVLLVERYPPSRYLRPFVAVGFIGAYTTFSTFVVEADLLVKDGHAGLALVYVTASVAAGLLAVWSGLVIARRLPVRARRGGRARGGSAR